MITKVETNTEMVQLREVFTTALRSVSEFPVFQVKIYSNDNRCGIGACVATPAIVGDEFEKFSYIFKNQIEQLLLDSRLDEISQLDVWPSIKSAVDCAIHQLQDPQTSVTVKTDVTIPMATDEELALITRNRVAAGFSTLKIKLGKDAIQSNIKKISMIRELTEGNAALRIDPNQAWTVPETLEFIEKLAQLEIPIEYIEQPIAAEDISGMKTIRNLSNIEIMADESCFSLEDAKRLIGEGACDYINIKLLKAGGITSAEEIARECLASGMKISVGSMMESDEGVRAAVNFAHKFAPNVVHDLDAAWWIKGSTLKYDQGRVWS